MNPAVRIQLYVPVFRPFFVPGRGALGLPFDFKAGYAKFPIRGFDGLGDFILGHIL